MKQLADPFQTLAQAAIIEAARQAREGNIEARYWLAHPETWDLFFTIAGLSDRAVLKWLDMTKPKEEKRGKIQSA